jgi:hypothetical protein
MTLRYIQRRIGCVGMGWEGGVGVGSSGEQLLFLLLDIRIWNRIEYSRIEYSGIKRGGSQSLYLSKSPPEVKKKEISTIYPGIASHLISSHLTTTSHPIPCYAMYGTVLYKYSGLECLLACVACCTNLSRACICWLVVLLQDPTCFTCLLYLRCFVGCTSTTVPCLSSF